MEAPRNKPEIAFPGPLPTNGKLDRAQHSVVLEVDGNLERITCLLSMLG